MTLLRSKYQMTGFGFRSLIPTCSIGLKGWLSVKGLMLMCLNLMSPLLVFKDLNQMTLWQILSEAILEHLVFSDMHSLI